MLAGILAYSFFVVVSLFGIAFQGESVEPGSIDGAVLWVSLFLLLYLINIIYWGLCGRSVLTPESFFVGFYSLFHFSYVVLYVYGLSDYDHEVFYHEPSLTKAIYFCLACVCVFILSYRISFIGRASTGVARINRCSFIGVGGDKAIEISYYFSKWILMAALLLFWVPVIPVCGVVFSDYKSLISIGEISPLGRLFWLSQYVGYAGFAIYLTTKFQTGRRLLSGYSTVLLYAYMGSFLLTGDRGGFISYLFICVFAYTIYENSIGIKKIAIFSIVLLFISSVVSVVRSQSMLNPIEMIYFYVEGGNAFSVYDAVSEFGVSIKTVVIALYFVPRSYGLWYGSSFIDSLLIVFPNPFSPRVSEGIGTFVTQVAFGPIGSTHGRGGSIAMEAYLNFWYFGVFLFSLYGFYLKYIYSRLMRSPSALMSVLLLSSIGAFSMWMRNTSGVSFRIVIWSILIMYLVRYFSTRLKYKL